MKYNSWATVAGFFDGDGSVAEKVGSYVISVVLGFTDNWPEQLRAVRRFLVEQGIKVGRLTKRKWKGKDSSWQVRICNIEGVFEAATQMLPHVVKKRAELQAVVDYIQNRISGDEFVRRVNHEVAIGNKVGKYKSSHLPLTRSQGNKLRREISLGRARAANLIRVPDDLSLAIRNQYRTGKHSMQELSRHYGVKIWIVHRILGKHY